MQWNGASCFEFIGKSVETETTSSSEFPKKFQKKEINSKEEDCESHSQGSE